jgi:hypothetical protein
MFAFAQWCLLKLGLCLAFLPGTPVFLFVPAEIFNWLEMPKTDEVGCLVSATHYTDILGHKVPVEAFRFVDTGTPDGRPATIRLIVDKSWVSSADVELAMTRIRSGWDPKKRVVFLMQVCRSTTTRP